MRFAPLSAALALVFLVACTDAPAPSAPVSRVGGHPLRVDGVWVVNWDDCDPVVDPLMCIGGNIPELRLEWGGAESFLPGFGEPKSPCCTYWSPGFVWVLTNAGSSEPAAVDVSVWIWVPSAEIIWLGRYDISPAGDTTFLEHAYEFHAAARAWTELAFRMSAPPGGATRVVYSSWYVWPFWDDMTFRRPEPVPPDVAPPVLHFTQAATELWPANHALVAAITGISAVDDVDGAVPVAVTVESPGGPTDYEIVSHDDGTQDVLLRAVRSSNEVERVYRVFLSARDRAGNEAADTLRVIVPDRDPPIIRFTQALTEVWPVNHMLVPAITGISATDDVDGAVAVGVSVESPGGPADYEIVARGDGTQDVLLRAERLGNGGDRVYRVVLSASDGRGNAASRTLQVVVPHDQGRR